MSERATAPNARRKPFKLLIFIGNYFVFKSKRSVRFILEKDDVPATAHVQIQYFVWWMINSIFWNIKECS